MSLISCDDYIILKPVIEAGVSYSTQIQPIFDKGCVSCHPDIKDLDLSPEQSYDALFDGSYVDTLAPESSELYLKLRGTHDSRATEEEKLIILQWITEGALNN